MEWVELLTSGSEGAPQAWRQLQTTLAARQTQVAEALARHPDDEERGRILRVLLYVLARSALQDVHTRRWLFDQGEALGVHFLRVHFYSPIPDTRELGEHVWATRWDEVPGFDWRADRQMVLLERFGGWAAELSDTPVDKPEREGGYYFNNGAFGALDAIAYYSMIREFRPRTVLEVGSGFSTMVAAKAAVRNTTTQVRAIEPFPSPALKRGFPGLTALISKRLQDVDLDLFDSLEPNDILFVDSTHTSKIDSDVNHLILRILPRLRPGVLIHFHDIHLPWDYGQGYTRNHKRFWNEQYLLLAFLLFNKAFHVVWGSCYMGHFAAEALRAAFPFAPKLMGSSLWIKKDG